eukprot:TRINITY_DN3745_c0_g1_i6.p1 TRINITY_DN3745_c0_g1~~TRINITY_DN3745_c0_g1_i6.p1  ORF type:complete len:203 (+),score=42.90 TRINITY_DN3745_c0_g1_i6:237-845(+)
MIQYYGMDTATMTPFMVKALSTEMGGDGNIELTCVEGRWSNGEKVRMSGVFNFSGNWDKAEIKANCIVKETREVWVIESNEMEKKTIYFSYEESGLRARSLIGQSSQKYNSSNVISYAILDYPYTDLNCELIFNRFPDEETSKPGTIILGKDKVNCGIIDNEGSKFVHSDVSKGIVTATPLSLAKRFFPEGFVYKGYPPKSK